MIKSRLTTKAQTTIPQPVRIALGLREGDEISYEIEGDRAVLRKAGTEPEEDPFAVFDEWNSEADRKGYADF
jgi:antitoxin PrlF